MNRKQFFKCTGILSLALIFTMTMGGCGMKNGGSESTIYQSADYTVEEIDVDEGQESFDALLSYANFKYIENGAGGSNSTTASGTSNETEDLDPSDTTDEDLVATAGKTEKMIRKVKKKIHIEGNDKKTKVDAVINALKSVPSKEEDAETFVNDKFTINSLRITGGNVVIDISSEGLEDTNLYEEEFFVYQLADSILNTFDDIKGVRFTVDSEETKELNYIDISEAFTRADVSDFLDDEESDSADSEENQQNEETDADGTTASGMAAASGSTSTAANNTSAAKNNTSSSNSSKNSTSTSSSSSTTKNNNSSSTSKNNGNSSNKKNTSSGSTGGNSSTSGGSSSTSGGSGSTSGGSGSTSGGSGSTSGGSGSTSGGSGSTSGGSGSTSGGSGSTSGGSSSGGSSSGGGSTGTVQDGVVND